MISINPWNLQKTLHSLRLVWKFRWCLRAQELRKAMPRKRLKVHGDSGLPQAQGSDYSSASTLLHPVLARWPLWQLLQLSRNCCSEQSWLKIASKASRHHLRPVLRPFQLFTMSVQSTTQKIKIVDKGLDAATIKKLWVLFYTLLTSWFMANDPAGQVRQSLLKSCTCVKRLMECCSSASWSTSPSTRPPGSKRASLCLAAWTMMSDIRLTLNRESSRSGWRLMFALFALTE